MIILKNAGRFEIIPYPGLTPQEDLVGQLLGIERAGRTCYQSERGEINIESATKFVRMLLEPKRRHESVLEHGVMKVKFFNVSRGLTHELVRHRLASYSQESTRYVDYLVRGEGPNLKGFELRCVVPPHRDENETVQLEDGRSMSPVDMFKDIEMFYRALRLADWSPEDARQVLPTALKSEIVVTANFREWRHILRMRTQKAAHWEIRSVMCDLLEELKTIVPVLFEDFVLAGEDKWGLRYYEQRSLS